MLDPMNHSNSLADDLVYQYYDFILAGAVDSMYEELAKFVEKLKFGNDGIDKASEQLNQRFSDPARSKDESNKYFIHTIKQMDLKIQERLFEDAPSDLFTQEDIDDETLLHMIAEQKVLINE